MFIENICGLDKDIIVLNKFAGEYIAKNGFPILSVTKDGRYVFANGKYIKYAISKIPFFLRPFCKVVMDN